jgi:hypothetical protein
MTNQLTRTFLLVSISLLVLIPRGVFSQVHTLTARHQKTNVCHLHVDVTAGQEAEPVSGADVFVTTESEDTPFERTLRTDKHGAVTFARVPRVKILIQVTAAGFNTFGKRYELEAENKTIAIKLEKNNDGRR